jgi:hypothetical protein
VAANSAEMEILAHSVPQNSWLLIKADVYVELELIKMLLLIKTLVLVNAKMAIT